MSEDTAEFAVEDPDQYMAPGGPSALASGCVCSVLANAAYRAGASDEPPLIDPHCPLHALA